MGSVVVFTILGLAAAYGLWLAACRMFGLSLGVVALWQSRRIERGSRVIGTVVGHHQEGTGRRLVYSPEIQYRIPDGRELRHRFKERRSHAWPPVGTEVELAYDLANPSEAVVTKLLLKARPPNRNVQNRGKLP